MQISVNEYRDEIMKDISHREVYALVDINNCYVSCERLFNPKLNDKPVVVLSNNDGCVVSRSEDYVELNSIEKSL